MAVAEVTGERKPLYQMTDVELEALSRSRLATSQERKMARTILVNRWLQQRRKGKGRR